MTFVTTARLTSALNCSLSVGEIVDRASSVCTTPITGMIVLGVVQTLLALSTISPTLSEQFSALVNLAVVTNVIPYVVSLSALFIMMRTAKVAENVWRRNVFIVVIAMVYSVFALYASGKDAVMGGMLVLGVAYIIWGFLAPRFTASASAIAERGKKA